MTGVNDELSRAIPFGLLELDDDGTVISYSPAAGHDTVPAQDILGRNFFTEVAPAPEVRELLDRFRTFMSNGESVQRYSLTYPSARGNVQVQIVLARLGGRSGVTRERLALVRLTPERDENVTSTE
jgi:photoactive yellow protein